MNDSLKNYLECEELLNDFFKELGYCRSDCFLDYDVRCCKKNYFGTKRLLEELHNERLKKYGIPAEKIRECSYHTEKGCLLETHKSPTCLAWVCNSLEEYLHSIGVEYYLVDIRFSLMQILRNELGQDEIICFKQNIKNMTKKIKSLK